MCVVAKGSAELNYQRERERERNGEANKVRTRSQSMLAIGFGQKETAERRTCLCVPLLEFRSFARSK